MSTSARTPDLSALPAHVGIIMDGNGRWAVERKLPRTAGHKEGLTAAKRIVKAAADIGIKYLTLYVFSTENWKRAEEEVSFLMKLISQYLKKELDFYRENRVRVRHVGDIAGLPHFVRKDIEEAMKDTAGFEGITVNLAINYGGRDEIVRAVNGWLTANDGKTGPFNEEDIRMNLDCPDVPDPDLIIRTGDEKRLSNFLLWETAYSEYFFSPKLWPDFNEQDFVDALADFGRRARRYGGVS